MDAVVQCQRGRLHRRRLDPRVLVVQQVITNQVALHREDADFDVRGVLLLESLVVPDHLVHVEGDLLFRLVAHDFGDFLGFHRGELAEAGQGVLARHAHHDRGVGNVVAGKEGLQRRGDQRLVVRVGLRKDLLVLDEIHREQFELPLRPRTELERFEGTLADVESPNR